jgi:anti-sigma factor RsiW
MKKMDPFDFAATWMAYRQGQMTAEAANAFEAELAADPRLKALHEALLPLFCCLLPVLLPM